MSSTVRAGSAESVPRGRHAPPLEVRVAKQRTRLLAGAAAVFARQGYAEASAEAISREAGMSKATFYEHFPNKEECILALFDASAQGVLAAIAAATARAEDDLVARLRAGIAAFLDVLARHPDESQTLLVEIIGAGPRAMERRDAVFEAFAEMLQAENAATATRSGAPRFASGDDAFAVVGAVGELAARRLRQGRAEDVRDLAPLIERLILGLLGQRADPR